MFYEWKVCFFILNNMNVLNIELFCWFVLGWICGVIFGFCKNDIRDVKYLLSIVCLGCC